MSIDNEVYLRVREKEGRLYTDDIVRHLPGIPSGHPLAEEWRARTASSRRLGAHLGRFRGAATILELGCGNGWLANTIVKTAGLSVVGMDRPSLELGQARRVFAHQEELSWVAGDIFSAPFSGGRFNAIVIASAIQYFPDIQRLIQSLVQMLRAGGEIHILDSPFYSAEELPAARERSKKYYELLGIPEMAAHYYHHSLSALASYDPAWLYTPEARRGSTPLMDSPFPWICLRF